VIIVSAGSYKNRRCGGDISGCGGDVSGCGGDVSGCGWLDVALSCFNIFRLLQLNWICELNFGRDSNVKK
jgi:hypothetical protein